MSHPYQCLLYCHRPQEPISRVLVAAYGSYIHAFDVLNGQNLSSWSSIDQVLSFLPKKKVLPSSSGDDTLKEKESADLQPPSKRRKTSPRAAISTESSSTEIVVEGNGYEEGSHSNPVIKLAATSDGRHVIAVTSEDKCLRVFELSGDGAMHQISERLTPNLHC